MMLSMILVLTMLAACASNNNGNVNETNESTSTNEPANTDGATSDPEAEEEALTGNLITKDPLELSIHLLLGGSSFDDEWVVFQEAAKQTNVSLKGTISKSITDRKEIFNLMMASGDLADVVSALKGEFEQFGEQGAFIPLNDLIDEHAPNIKKFFETYPEVRKIATAADGNIYYIPFKPDGEAATGWFIRQDWLKNVGLDTPKTVDEYYAALKAFKEQDPNGNGKADEIPYFHGATSFGVYFLLSLWDSTKEFYVDGGEVKFGPLDPQFKTGMTNLAKWYQEGLIDQEIFTRGGSARETLLGDNIGGSTHDWFGSTAGFNNSVGEKVPDFEFLPIAPPASASGVVAEYDFRATVRDLGWGISSENEHPVETIKYFDYFFTEEGRRLMNFGVEGLTYNMVDGKPVFTDELLAESNIVDKLKKEYGVQVEVGFHQDFEYEKQWMNEIALEGVNEYLDNGYIVQNRLPNLNYTQEEQARIQELLGPINTFRDETGQKWILGAESVEEGYDAFVNQLKQMNIEELLEIYNTAYDRYLAL